MNKNSLDKYLNCAKEEEINFQNIERKCKYLTKALPQYYINPKTPIITALSLFALATILGVYNYNNNNYQEKIALELLQKERNTIMNTDYIYTTLTSSYINNYNGE